MSAKILTRNPHFDDIIDPKPIIHRKPPQSCYKDNSYLDRTRAIKNPKYSKTKSSIKEDQKHFMAPISVEIERRKHKINPPIKNITRGKEVNSIDSFNQAKGHTDLSKTSTGLKNAFLYVSKNEFDYTTNKQRPQTASQQ